MKVLLSVLCVFLFAGMANAADTHKYMSEPDSFFCQTLSDLEAVIRYTQQGDKVALAKLFDSDRCAIVKPSLDLYIEQENGAMVKIRRAGMTTPLWTLRKFLK